MSDDDEPIYCEVCVEDDDGSEAAAWRADVEGYVSFGVTEHDAEEDTFSVCSVHAQELRDTLRECGDFRLVGEDVFEAPAGVALVVLEPAEGAKGAAALATFRALVCIDCAEGVLDSCGHYEEDDSAEELPS